MGIVVLQFSLAPRRIVTYVCRNRQNIQALPTSLWEGRNIRHGKPLQDENQSLFACIRGELKAIFRYSYDPKLIEEDVGFQMRRPGAVLNTSPTTQRPPSISYLKTIYVRQSDAMPMHCRADATSKRVLITAKSTGILARNAPA